MTDAEKIANLLNEAAVNARKAYVAANSAASLIREDDRNFDNTSVANMSDMMSVLMKGLANEAVMWNAIAVRMDMDADFDEE